MQHLKKCLLVLTLFVSACAATKEAVTEAPPPPPVRMRFDKQCITIDGKDLVIFSGAFHYFRCPRELWAERFRKLKEAGFNAVETYVAWNWHERTPPSGLDDFSKVDMTELNDWLAMATDQFGFQVILRPGPYICAEWDGGGYPQWLIPLRPTDLKRKQWFRGDDPVYLAWCKHWYTAVARTAAPYQITHRPAGKAGIILWQIENEYNYCNQPIEVKHNQLLFLAHTARDLGIDVPLTTCMTDNPIFQRDAYLKQNVIETRNTYPKFDMTSMQKSIGMLDRYQPDAFKMISELQGGWFSQVGGKLSEAQGFNASHINHVTLYAWEHGYTVTNYYMGFGGTNFGDWAAASITTTYDYDAPVREAGGITERYLAVQALGHFIAEHGSNLSRTVSEEIASSETGDASVVVSLRRANDGSRYLFARTERRTGTRQGELKVLTAGPNAVEISGHYDLGPFGSKVLYLPPGATRDRDGQWYPKPVEAPRRPGDLPTAIEITDARMQVDSGPTEWKKLEPDQGEESAGIFNRGFVFYRATVPATNPIVFSTVTTGRDWAGFTWNGQRVMSDGHSTSYTLGGSAGGTLIGLFENFGRANNGPDMERRNGLFGLKFQPEVAVEWQISDQTAGVAGKWWNSDFDDSAWSAVKLDAQSTTPAATAPLLSWYRMKFELPTVNPHKWVPWKLHLDAVGNGFVYLNGHALGRWWEVGPQRDFYLPECWTQFGPGKSNVVTISLRPTEAVGIRSARVEPYANLAEERP